MLTADPAQPKATFVPTLPPAPDPVAPVAPPETGSTGGEFVLGFALLKAQLGPVMGDPIEPEQGNPDNCDTQQLTTAGLAYWRCSTNLLGFAAFPDGAVHWASAPPKPGLVEWIGPDADPPLDASTIVAQAPVADASAPVADDDPQFTTACLAAASVPSMMCASGDSRYALGTIQDSGDTSSFNLNVPPGGLHLTADLVDLPADYDLYLADSSGTIIGQSIEEGTTPEHIEVDVQGGTYYLYVHSDPGRYVDAQDPFRLQVSVSALPATAAPRDTAPPESAGAN